MNGILTSAPTSKQHRHRRPRPLPGWLQAGVIVVLFCQPPPNAETTLTYGLSGDALKVTQITDPYNRSATFSYTNEAGVWQLTGSLAGDCAYDNNGNRVTRTIRKKSLGTLCTEPSEVG